jgi:putative hydrolase of the HAD superfamily
MTARSRRYDAVLFDWDDTLCGAVPHRYHHAQEVARAFGVDVSLAEVYRAFARAGDSSALPWSVVGARIPGLLGIHPDAWSHYEHAFLQRAVYRRFELFDDVLDLIEHLGRHELRVGVLSNNTEVAEHIERLDVRHRFEIVVSPVTWGIAKPDPEIFRRTAASMGIEPCRVLYVGDSYDNDVVGARAAGMTPVLVDRFGINLNDLDAEHRIADLRRLRALLEELLYA